mgnify:CR=1 FL=1
MYQILDERLSYQNRGLEHRDAYRVIVYIKNAMRGRIEVKKSASGSLLYGLVMSVRQNGVSVTGKEELEEACLERLVIDGQRVLIGWNHMDGVYILAESKEGNALIEEIAYMLKNENIWWNKCSG